MAVAVRSLCVVLTIRPTRSVVLAASHHDARNLRQVVAKPFTGVF